MKTCIVLFSFLIFAGESAGYVQMLSIEDPMRTLPAIICSEDSGTFGISVSDAVVGLRKEIQAFKRNHGFKDDDITISSLTTAAAAGGTRAAVSACVLVDKK